MTGLEVIESVVIDSRILISIARFPFISSPMFLIHDGENIFGDAIAVGNKGGTNAVEFLYANDHIG